MGMDLTQPPPYFHKRPRDMRSPSIVFSDLGETHRSRGGGTGIARVRYVGVISASRNSTDASLGGAFVLHGITSGRGPRRC